MFLKYILLLQVVFYSFFLDGKGFEEEYPVVFSHVNVFSGCLDFLPSSDGRKNEEWYGGPLFQYFSKTQEPSERGWGVLLENLNYSGESLRFFHSSSVPGVPLLRGWHFLPRLVALLVPGENDRLELLIKDAAGGIHHYHQTGGSGQHYYFGATQPSSYLPKALGGGQLSCRETLVAAHKGNQTITLSFSSGHKLVYHRASSLHSFDLGGYYLLKKEVDERGHISQYHYDDQQKIRTIVRMTPTYKEYGRISFQYEYASGRESINDLSIHVFSKGKRTASYFLTKSQNEAEFALVGAENAQGVHESFLYTTLCVGHFPVLSDYYRAGEHLFSVAYDKDPSSEHFGKVLDVSYNVDNSLQKAFSMSYRDTQTSINLSTGGTWIYDWLKQGALAQVSFTEEEKFVKGYCYSWRHGCLDSITLMDEKKVAVAKKSYSYDAMGNLLEERIEGPIQGGLDKIRQEYQWDSSCWSYEYYPKTHLVKKAYQNGRLCTEYEYLPGTSLLTKQLSWHEGQIIYRKFWEYDEDHNLIMAWEDDGQENAVEDKRGVTQRLSTSYSWTTQLQLLEKKLFLEHPDASHDILVSRECYVYSPDGLLTRCEHHAGNGELLNKQEWEYDSWGRMILERHDLGRVSTWEYDAQDRITFCKVPGKPLSQFIYDAWGNLIEKRLGDGSCWEKFIRDVWGNVIITKSPMGETHCFYDVLSRCVEKRLPLVYDQHCQLYIPKYQFSYDAFNNQKKVIWPNGSSESIIYNAFGAPLSHENRCGRKTYYQYTLQGKLKEKSSQGVRESFLYDAFGNVSLRQLFSKTYDLIEEELWHYNAFHLLSYKEPSGKRYSYLYNKLGQKCSEIGGKKTCTFSYDLHGNLTDRFDGTRQFSVRYNSLGEILEEWVVLPSGKREGHKRFFYDTEGRKSLVLHQGDKEVFTEVFHYDNMHRLVSYVNPLGAVWTYHNKNQSNAEGVHFQVYIEVDAEGSQVITTKDALGRKVSLEKKNTAGEVISWEEYRYDKLNNGVHTLCSIYKGEAKVGELSHRKVYNDQGVLVEEFSQQGKNKISYFYDAQGNLLKKRLGNGVELYYQYDQLGHILDLSSSDGGIHYSYIYDKRGRLISMKDVCAGLSWDREYDPMGYLQEEKNSLGFSMKWENDCEGQPLYMSLPDGSSVGYKYEEGRLQRLSRYDKQKKISYSHAYTEFDCHGQVLKEVFPGDVGSIVKKRDALGRVCSLRSPLYDWSAKYSPSGRLEEVVHSQSSIIKEYSYDSLGQVSSDGEKMYQFDSLGNRLEGGVDAFHQLVYHPDGIEVEYDELGRVVVLQSSQGIKKYYYDALDRLVKVAMEFDTVHYQYDPLSRRSSFWLESLGPENKSFYLYDPEYEIGYMDSNKNMIALRVLGAGVKGDIGGAVCIELRNVPYIPLQDVQGNIIGLSSFDGTVVEKYQYDIFGKGDLSSPLGNPWMYSSKSVEPCGEIFFGGRFYQPQLQRWLTPDPLGLIDGGNLYGYVQNDPINHVDVLGFAKEPIFCHQYAHVSTELLPSSGEWAHLEVEEKLHDYSLVSFWGSNQWGNITLSQREAEMGVCNLWDHFSELLQSEDSSCVTYGNGVNTSFSDWVSMGELVGAHIPSALVLSVYNPSQGILADLARLAVECFGIQTTTVRTTAAFLHQISKKITQHPERKRWCHIPHSEHAVITRLSLDLLSNSVEVRNQMEICAVAPFIPLSKRYGRCVINGYARDDYCVTPIGMNFKHQNGYNLIFRNSIASTAERWAGISDHFFSSPSYISIWKNFIQK